MTDTKTSKLLLQVLLFVAIFNAATVYGQAGQTGKKRLTVELATSPAALFSRGISNVQWRPGGKEVSYIRTQGSGKSAETALWVFEVASKQERQLASEGPKSEGSGDDSLNLNSYQWSPKGDSLLVEGSKDFWLINAASRQKTRLTADAEAKEDATFSPNGDRIAFVKNSDIYVVTLADRSVKRLTNSSGEVMNGKLDWVYEEELADRATGRAYEWSPDGTKVAFLRLDDTPVPKYPLTSYLSTHVELSYERFPQPGDSSPVPSIHVAAVDGSWEDSWAPTAEDGDIEYYGPAFSWTSDSKSIAFLTMNRAQTLVAVHLWNFAEKTSRRLLTESDATWINSLAPPYFLRDGKRFLWLSERDGWLHMYLYNLDGSLVRQMTKGEWMIDHPAFTNVPMFEVDESSGWIYFASTHPDPRQRQVYRVQIDGTRMQRLTKDPGYHSFDTSPAGQAFIESYSSIESSPQIRLLSSDGSFLATLDKPENHLGEYELASTELVQVKADDGTPLYGRLVKPADFDSHKKYPVIINVYGGPHAQLVQNRWGVTGLMDDVLAQEGFLVWSLDNRGSWGRGHAFESVVFEHLGKLELEDQLAGVAYLRSLPYVDGDRLGIWGWSYGGYMTLYALTHAPDVFKCGLAGGPVTDWTFYDSIYTERYMRTPKENPDGYRDASPLEAASNLKSKVLLVHGADDDNVHMQNTMNFINALVKAGKAFDLYIQPGERHGFARPQDRLYLNKKLLEFFRQNLKP